MGVSHVRHVLMCATEGLERVLSGGTTNEFTFLVEESNRATLADLLTYKSSPNLVKEEVVRRVFEEVPQISNAYVLFFDGSYRESHDAASGGIALYDPEGKLICKKGFKLAAHSNNEAECATLEAGLHICLKHGIRRVCIKGDALLVVKQVLGVWKSKNMTLKERCFKIKGLLKKFEAWNIKHIERVVNEEAHKAAQGMIW